MSVNGVGGGFHQPKQVNTAGAINNNISLNNKIENKKEVKEPTLNLANKVNFSVLGNKKEFSKELSFVSPANNKSLAVSTFSNIANGIDLIDGRRHEIAKKLLNELKSL